jgi:alpha-galactosidase
MHRDALRLLAGLVVCGTVSSLHAQDAVPSFGGAPRAITISTARSSLILAVGTDGRLYQNHYGAPRAVPPRGAPAREDEFYPQAGNGFITEPALAVAHADGNTSTDLIYVSHDSTTLSEGVTLTRIKLRDGAYPFFVTLFLEAYRDEDVLKQWVEISHEESGPVVLSRFASGAPVQKAASYWLTQFQGNYMREVELSEERLTPGTKLLESKLGVRAHQMRNPSFVLSLDGPAREESGAVLGGTLAWSGSFALAFEIDHTNRLRALCGINSFGAPYRLAPGKTFKTPAMLWSWSAAGKGPLSRNFHRWARRYGIRDGDKPRPVLLNNWEATHFDFDEQKIVSLFEGAATLGAELFLLDDGWFGNKYPRDDDKAGLGDWEVNARKLPHGLSALVTEAKKRGLGFGIWLEPEMVNPKSELFEKHPDWVIRQPKRDLLFGRNQLVLDLTRPEVKEFVWQVVDRTFSAAPGTAYVKWDANRYVTQPGSSHLGAFEQPHLLIDYQWALYDVMERMAKKYPQIMAMVCAGGSGRVDYGALRYFHSFWPSDNTDPVQRIRIQWGFSHFFPAATIAAHVTDMGKKPAKFAVDVALSGAFGVDRDVQKMSPEERKTVAAGAKLYKESLRELVLQGDLFRLESPYEQPRAVLSYLSSDRSRAVVFAYQLGETAFGPIRPRGLDPARRYRVREINLPEGTRSRLSVHDQVLDGQALMDEGFNSPLRRSVESAVIELVAER